MIIAMEDTGAWRRPRTPEVGPEHAAQVRSQHCFAPEAAGSPAFLILVPCPLTGARAERMGPGWACRSFPGTEVTAGDPL